MSVFLTLKPNSEPASPSGQGPAWWRSQILPLRMHLPGQAPSLSHRDQGWWQGWAVGGGMECHHTGLVDSGQIPFPHSPASSFLLRVLPWERCLKCVCVAQSTGARPVRCD